MKEYIDTMPIHEAYETADECPFCYLERQVEQKAIRYALGPSASYMEPDVRAATDAQGFCRAHFKKFFDYGNSLGNALVMQTYLVGLRKELENQLAEFQLPQKKSLFTKKDVAPLPILQWLEHKNHSCFLCNKIDYNMRRYYATFFHMIKESEFRARVENSKGFCFRHFGQLLEKAEQSLPNSQREWFYERVPALMEENLARVQEDLDWLVCKYDYRYLNADWKNSRDALQRSMQKIEGIYPADKPYKND